MWELLKDFLLVSVGTGIGVALMCILSVGKGAPDKLRTVHFFFLQFYNFSVFQTRTSRFQMAINKSLHHHQFNFRLD